MISYLLSRAALFLASTVSHWVGWPLEQYVRFRGALPLLRPGCTGFRVHAKDVALWARGWTEMLLQAGLPLQLKAAQIDEIQFKFSVCGPIVISVKGVYALVQTSHKRSAFANHDSVTGKKGKGKKGSRPGWIRRQMNKLFSRLFFWMVKKVKVDIENVHIRLEDQLSTEGKPLAVGCTLRKFTVEESLDWTNTPSSVSVKEAELTDVSLYWNASTNDLMAELAPDEVVARLKSISFLKAVGLSYVLNPTSGLISLQMSNGVSSFVDVMVGTLMDVMKLKVSKDQLQSVVDLLGYMARYRTTLSFLALRPVQPVLGNSKLWWQYAVRAVVRSIRHTHHAGLMNQSKEPTAETLLTVSSVTCGLAGVELKLVEEEEEAGETVVVKMDVTGTHLKMVHQSGEFSVEAEINSVQCTGLAGKYSPAHVLLSKRKFSGHSNRSTKPALVSGQCISSGPTDPTKPVVRAWLKSHRKSSVPSLQNEVDYEANVSLEPLLLLIDPTTLVKLAQMASVFRNTHKDLQARVKEVLQDVSHESKRRIKMVLENSEVIGVTADLSLPMILLPKDSITESSGRFLVLDLGHLAVNTTVNPTSPEEASSSNTLYRDKCLVEYDVRLTSTAVYLPNSDHRWQALLQSPVLPHNIAQLVDVTFRAFLNVSSGTDGRQMPSAGVEGAVPSVAIQLSKKDLEEGTLFASKQIKTVTKLHEAFFGPTLVVNKGELVGAASTDSTLMMESAAQPTSYRSRVLVDTVREASVSSTDSLCDEDYLPSLLCISCTINEFSFTLTDEQDGVSRDFLELSVQCVTARADQRSEELRCDLVVTSITLRDHTMYHDENHGVSLVILTTQEPFLTAEAHIADTDLWSAQGMVDPVITDVSVATSACTLRLYKDFLLHVVHFLLDINLQNAIYNIYDSVSAFLLCYFPTLSDGGLSPPQSPLSPKHCEVLPENFIKLRLHIKFPKVSVSLCRDASLVDCCISDIESTVIQRSSGTMLKASIDHLTMMDALYLQDEYHKVITVGSAGKKLLQVDCSLNKPLPLDRALSSNLVPPALELQATVGEVTVVLLNCFIQRIMSCTMPIVQEALLAWGKVSPVWTAQQQVTPECVVPFIYHFSIDVKDFTLVIPKCSSSNERIDVTIRNVSLSNCFVESCDMKEEDSMSTELDFSTIPSTVLKEKVALVTNELSIVRVNSIGPAKNNVLSCPRITAELQRIILPTSDVSPLFSLNIELGNMEAHISDADLGVLPAILLANLSESTEVSEPLAGHVPSLSHEGSSKEEGMKSRMEGEREGDKESRVRVQPNPRGSKLFHADVHLGPLSCSFLLEHESQEGCSCQKMCDVNIIELMSSLDFGVDCSLQASAVLSDITVVEDSTAQRKTWLLHHSLCPEKRDQERDMVSLSLEMDPSFSGNVEVSICRLHGFIWPSFVVTLLKFGEGLLLNLPKKGSTADTAPIDFGEEEAASRDGEGDVFGPQLKAKVKINSVSVGMLNGPPSSMIYGVCAQLESRVKDVCAAELAFCLSQWEISAAIDPLWVEASLCAVDTNVIKMSQVMAPSCIHVSYLSTTRNETANLTAERMVFFLSTEAVRIMLNPISQIVQNWFSDDNPRNEADCCGNLWEVQTIDRSQVFSSLSQADNRVVVDEIPQFSTQQEKASVSLPEVVVNWNIEYGGDGSSVVSLTTAIEAAASSWTTEPMVDLELKTEAFVYNRRVAAWEPLLEPLEDFVQECYRPWSLIIKARWMGSQGDQSTGVSMLPGDLSEKEAASVSASSKLTVSKEKSFVVVVSSSDRLELTVSPGSLDTLVEIVKDLGENEDKIYARLLRSVQATPSVVDIQNKTGLDITIFPGPTFDLGAHGEPYTNPICLPWQSESESSKRLHSIGDGTDQERRPHVGASDEYLSLATSTLFDMEESMEEEEEEEEGEEEEEEDEEGEEEGEVGEGEGEEGEGDVERQFDSMEEERGDSMHGGRSRGGHQFLGKLKKRAKYIVSSKRRPYLSVTGSVVAKVSLRKKLKWKPRSLSKNHKICLQTGEGKKTKPVSISFPGSVPISLSQKTDHEHKRDSRRFIGLCDISISGGNRHVVIRSGVQVRNSLPIPISLFVRSHEAILFLTEIESRISFDVPVEVAAAGSDLLVDVGNSGSCCSKAIGWKRMAEERCSIVLECPHTGAKIGTDSEVAFIRVDVEKQPVVGTRESSNCIACTIDLKAPLTLQNLLPLPVKLSWKGADAATVAGSMPTLEPGQEKEVYHLEPGSEYTFVVELASYQKTDWRGECTVEVGKTASTQIKMRGIEDSTRKMYFGIHCDEKRSPSILSLYCPYWVVNKTGLVMEYEYQPSRLHRNIYYTDFGQENLTALLYFKPRVDEKHRKLKIRVSQGQWSDCFSLGTTGSATNITSSSHGQLYEFGIQNHLSQSRLTNIIYILPKFMIVNKTEIESLTFNNCGTDGSGKQQTITLLPQELKPFWPGSRNSASLAVNVQSDGGPPLMEATSLFPLSELATTVLPTPLDNELSGLTVTVEPDASECCVLVSVTPYQEGSAPIRVDNLCQRLSVSFSQSGVAAKHHLLPGQSKLYTWDDPLARHQLLWKVEGEEEWIPLELEKGKRAGTRRARVRNAGGGRNEVECWWFVAFDGLQQVLRLLDSHNDYLMLAPPLATNAALFHLYASLDGVGLSVVNSMPVEVAYCCVLSSPVVWKQRIEGSKWQTMDTETSALLEIAWRTGQEEKTIGEVTYNLSSMTVKNGERGVLSRTFNPGVWMAASASNQEYSFNFSVGRLQVDNQLRSFVLPSRIVLGPAQLMNPANVAAPFFLARVVVEKTSLERKIIEFRNVYAEVKPMHVNIELGFVAALVPFLEYFTNDNLEVPLLQDMEQVKKTPLEILSIYEATATKLKTYFGKLLLAPMEMAITFTTAGEYDLSSVVGELLNSVIHFALFSKASFSIVLDAVEVCNRTLDIPQLVNLLMGHFINEVLTNIHSIALGLDIIGNPGRLLKSFEIGVKDFVESAKGTMEGDIGVVGVAEGVKGFLGHIIEGTAESADSSMGTFRHALLATTDLDYRKKYRELSRSASSEGLATNLFLGTRFFAEGLFHGITDIFLKPIAGAERRGVRGLFEGLGSGALATLTRPTLGVLDLAHFTLRGIRSAVDDDPELQSVRLPRFVDHTKIVTPYNSHNAEGLRILWTSDLRDDTYFGHEWLPDKRESGHVFLVSSHHLIQLRRDGRRFKSDGFSAKVEYLKHWEVICEEDSTVLYINYGDDSFLDKVGSWLLRRSDHKAEVVRHISIKMASYEAAIEIDEKIANAYTALMLSMQM